MILALRLQIQMSGSSGLYDGSLKRTRPQFHMTSGGSGVPSPKPVRSSSVIAPPALICVAAILFRETTRYLEESLERQLAYFARKYHCISRFLCVLSALRVHNIPAPRRVVSPGRERRRRGSVECKESLPPMNWIVQRCSLETGQRPCEKARLVARWDVLALLSARFACSERKEGGLNWIPATSYPRRSQWNGCWRCSRPGYHFTSDLDIVLGLIQIGPFSDRVADNSCWRDTEIYKVITSVVAKYALSQHCFHRTICICQ